MTGYSVIPSENVIPTTYAVMYTAEGMRGFYLRGGFKTPEAAWAAIPDRTKPPGEEPNVSFFRDDFAGMTRARLRQESGIPEPEDARDAVIRAARRIRYIVASLPREKWIDIKHEMLAEMEAILIPALDALDEAESAQPGEGA